MRAIAVALALVVATPGCNKQHQLTNGQLAMGAIGAGALIGLIVVLSLDQQCRDRYGSDCASNQPQP